MIRNRAYISVGLKRDQEVSVCLRRSKEVQGGIRRFKFSGGLSGSQEKVSEGLRRS